MKIIQIIKQKKIIQKKNRYKKNIATMGKIETMNYEEKEDTDEVLDINIKKRRDSQSS